MKTEFRLFKVPIDTPFVQTNPFQWYTVGSNVLAPGAGTIGDGADALPTAQPLLGSIGPVNGGPNEMDVKLLIVGLVTVP